MGKRIRTGALTGIEGLAVTAEVDISRGLPGFHLVGLPGAEVRESRDRVMAALRHAGVRIPPGRITVNLAPAGIRKAGASYDLAIAVGVAAAGDEKAGRRRTATAERERALLLGELSLFGELRPVRGLLAIVLAAAEKGPVTVVVPAEQAWEAALVAGVEVIGARTLADVMAWWRTGLSPGIFDRAPANGGPPGEVDPAQALAGLEGQSLVRKGAVVASVGGHHLLMMGPPGTGKTRLARILGRLQPDLDPDRALEVTRIHSAAGTLGQPALIRRPPLRAPHHTVTRAGLVGGGGAPRPGEVTLAHGGMLFLDELAEFNPRVLDALREPLEEGRVVLARGTGHHDYPARFQLVAAMNPCRCGFLGSEVRACRCRRHERARYLSRLSGPLLDRFDLFVEVGPWKGAYLTRKTKTRSPGKTSPKTGGDWRQYPDGSHLASARTVLKQWRAGGVRRRLAPRGARALDDAREALGLSLRGVERCLSVAATLAVLDGHRTIGSGPVAEALEFRRENLMAD